MEKKAARGLYIPVQIRRNKQIIDGFGKEEAMKTGMTVAIGLTIGIFLYSSGIVEAPLLIAVPALSGIVSVFFNIKNSFGMSLMDNLKMALEFSGKQHRYYYKHHNIYEKAAAKKQNKE